MRKIFAGLIAVVLMAGCAARSQPPAGAQPPGNRPDNVRVVRESPLRFLPPLERTLTDKAVAQKLYAELQALPEVATDRPVSCPADNGVTLDLGFKAGDNLVLQATAGLAGCRMVRVQGGAARYGAGEAGKTFFDDLAQALGEPLESLAGFDQGPLPAPAGKGSLTVRTDLTGIAMQNAQFGWAVGGGNLYRTGDGGWTWASVTPPGATVPGMGGSGSSPAFFRGPDYAWLAERREGEVAVHRTADGGRTWQTASVAGEGDGELYFLDAKQGWLLVHLGYAMSHEVVALYQTGDGGATWSKLTEVDPQKEQPGAIPFGGDKSGVTFLDAETGWITGFIPATGQVYLYVTHDGGRTWAPQPLAVPADLADASLSSLPVRFFGQDVAVLPILTGPSILFFVTHDHGKTWTPGTPVQARGKGENGLVWDFADVANGLVFDGSHLWATRDGGRTWTDSGVVPALQGATRLDFTGVGCWAVIGREPPTRLLLSTDGETWFPQ